MRRLAIALLGGRGLPAPCSATGDRPARAAACRAPSRRRPTHRVRPGRRAAGQRPDRPDRRRRHRRGHRALRRRRRPGPDPAGQLPRRRRRRRRDHGADGAHRRGADPGRHLDRSVGRPPVRHARPAARRGRCHRHGARARGSATPACRCARTASRSTSARRPTTLRDGSLGLSDARAPRRVRPAHLRRGHPDDRQHGQRPRRLRGGRRRPGDDRGLRHVDDGTARRDTTATVRFAKLGLVDQLFHTVASPAVTYLLLLIGLALLIFEFFTAGVGVAGVVGAVCTVLACTGLATLPARGWAVAPDPRGDARLRRRRPGRRAALLDRRRHRADRRSPA